MIAAKRTLSFGCCLEGRGAPCVTVRNAGNLFVSQRCKHTVPLAVPVKFRYTWSAKLAYNILIQNF